MTQTLVLLDKDFKLAILNMFIKVKIYRLKIKNLKQRSKKVKNKLNENTELKIHKIKNSLDGLNSRITMTEGRVSDLVRRERRGEKR